MFIFSRRDAAAAAESVAVRFVLGGGAAVASAAGESDGVGLGVGVVREAAWIRRSAAAVMERGVGCWWLG